MNRAALFLVALALIGCGGRAPVTDAEAKRVQNVANAQAGLDALLGVELDPITAEIVRGARGFVTATAERIQVPPPSMAPGAIRAKPADYRKAGDAAQRSAGRSPFVFWLEVASSLAVPFLIKFAKNCGPLGSAFGLVADGLYSALAPARSKEADAAAHAVAAHVHTLAGIVPRAVLDTLPPEFHAALAALAPAPEAEEPAA